MWYDCVVLKFDGAAKSIPRGPAACAWLLYEADTHGYELSAIEEGSQWLGKNKSCNFAEYKGLIHGLTFVHDNIECNTLYVRGDSKLVIEHMKGTWKVLSDNLRPLYNTAKDIDNHIRCEIIYEHIDRSWNTEADKLANDVIAAHAE